MKAFIGLMILASSSFAFAGPCTQTESGAVALAKLFVLENPSKIAEYAEFTDLVKFANKVASKPILTDEGYYNFIVVNDIDNLASRRSTIYLSVCEGVKLRKQFVD